MKKDERGNTSCMRKVLRENTDYVIAVKACDKADDSKGKKEDLVDYVHKGSGGESELRMDLCETGEADLRKPRQVRSGLGESNHE